MEGIIYAGIFVGFMIIVFYILRALRIERAFAAGHVFEIRCAYVLITLAFSYILSEFVCRMLGFAGINI